MPKEFYSIIIIFVGLLITRYGIFYGKTKQKEYKKLGIVADFKKTPASYGVSAIGAGRIITFTGFVATCWGLMLLLGYM